MTTTPQTNTTLEQIAEVLHARDDFVICGHVSPDGDCIGSQLALWHALRALGKNATCVLVKDDPLSADLSFMPGADEMIPAASFDGVACTFVGVDVPTRERIGEAACAILDRCDASVTIDHHEVPGAMCDLVYVDPDSASASVLVWQVVKHLLEEPPSESALCAYTGLVSDTGSFKYQNADATAFACASELVSRGVDPSYVATNVYQNRTLASIRLESLMVSRFELLHGGEVALGWVSAREMEELGAVKADVDELIETLRSLRGVRVACMLREQDGKVRGSLRAKDDTDVAMLARELGGGGHRAAAGLTLDMELEAARPFMREKLVALVSCGGVA
ncbi:MAG: DHH family phosphoesterase [Eggerthellaceae bacterium]|nr:DHH family phosphoesterase [Eggerthellaceae bacterium]